MSATVDGAGRAADAPVSATKARLGRGLILSYGLGELGTAIFIHAPNLLWLFFLTEVIGLDPTTAGLVILAPMVWDAVTDPAFGVLADRTWTRWGKYVPYLFLATPFCGLSFVLFFTDPGLAGTTAAWGALGVAVLFRTLLTLVIVPHNSLMARATRDSRERSVLAGSKMFFNALGMVAIALATRPMLAAEGRGEAGSFALFAAVGAVAATLLLWQCAFAFRRLDGREEAPSAQGAFDLALILRTLRTNPYLWVMVGAGIVGVMLLPAFAKSLLYFAKYNLADESWGPKGLLAFTGATALAVPLWGWLGRTREKVTLLRVSHAGLIVSLMMFWVLPDAARGPLLFAVLAVGAFTGGVNVMTFALLPDVVEAGQARTGRRVEAPVFGCFTFALKVGNGLGAGLLGLALGLVGFVQGQPVQAPSTQFGIETVMTVLPAFGSAAVLFLLRRWDLTHAVHTSLISSSVSANKRPRAARSHVH